MKMSSKIMATAAALAMGSFVASAGNAGSKYEGPKGGGHSQTTVKSSAVSKSGGVAVKGRDILGSGINEGSLALQYNKSYVEAKAGSASGTGAANATAGSTAETKSSSKGGGYGGGNPNTAEAKSGGSNGGGPKGSDGCGCGGTSASSEGSSAASASVGG